MPRRPAARALLRCAIAVTVLTAAVTLAGCGAGHPPSLTDPTPSSDVPTGPVDAVGQLAGLAAAAHDRRYVAAYTVSGTGTSGRSVLASLATDGTWQVDVTGGALGGGGNVAIVGLKTGTYQCLLSGPATTAATPTPPPAPPPGPSASVGASAEPSISASTSASPSPSPTPVRYPAPVCVKVAAAGKPVPKKYDPVFEHIFTDWLAVMLDRTAPISVFPASRLAHSAGACYSVESSSASLAPVIDSGIFCFTTDGTLTAAKIRAGTLTISGSAVAAPPTTTLPGPISTGPAAPTKAPVPTP
ncbi:MAG TPA: hypothetical protein VIR00_03470 [Micromonosporaceae bacterium]